MMDSKVPRNMVTVSLITPYYRVSGKVAVTAAGLVGLLNDPTDSYIEMETVTLVRIHRPQEVIAQFDVWSVVKSRIVTMLLEQKADIGRLSIARSGFQRTVAYRVWVAIQGYEMFGVIEAPGKFDVSATLFQGNRQFIALWNSTLIPVFFPQLVTRSPALLFNRTMVEGMGVISEVEPEKPAQPPVAPLLNH